MPNVVYFSHSYRPPDAGINDYFGRLLKSEHLIPSLDPPSSKVNAAKLERHLNYSDGMVAILAEREGGVSQHILYEIGLAHRSRKPMLVFVEDSLPTGLIPARLLQHRFSRRSYLRQAREHRQALRLLRSYLGEQPAPRYQQSTSRRGCLLIQASDLSQLLDPGFLPDLLASRLGYEPHLVPGEPTAMPDDQDWWELVSSVAVVLAVHGKEITPREAYVLGAMRGATKPLISLTLDQVVPIDPRIPPEYQTHVLESVEPTYLQRAVSLEFTLFEEDFLDLEDQEEVGRYARQLIELEGHYAAGTRERVTEVVMGDRYSVSGQAAAVGPNAHVHDVSFQQLWSQMEAGGKSDLPALAAELETVRQQARAAATTVEHDQVVAEIGSARLAAEEGDGPKALGHLAKVGRWGLSAAQGVGVGLAVAAIKTAIGM